MATADRSKALLRAQMRRRLAAVEPTTARGAAHAVADRSMRHPEVNRAATILICLSFGDELDTRPLIEHLLASGRQVCLPRCIEASRELSLHRYPCSLETLSFGLEQPIPESPRVEAAEVDLALLVGLAFDASGYRLGYGGGYFDRFLMAHPTPAVGLAYDLQVVPSVPNLDHDLPMTSIITESTTF